MELDVSILLLLFAQGFWFIVLILYLSKVNIGSFGVFFLRISCFPFSQFLKNIIKANPFSYNHKLCSIHYFRSLLFFKTFYHYLYYFAKSMHFMWFLLTVINIFNHINLILFSFDPFFFSANTSHFASTKKHRSTKIYNRINTENPIDYWERNYSENQVDWNV